MGIMNVQANQSDGRESVMCTGVRFSDDEGNTYFGRNLDWSFSYGETILVTPRGYHYDTVFGAGGKAKPNAVIGVGVVMADRPMYFDCANEHGLAIAGLNFPATPRSSTNRSKARKTSPRSNFRCGWRVISTPSTRSRRRSGT